MAYKLLTLNNPKILKGKDVDDTYISCVMHFRPINTKIKSFQLSSTNSVSVKRILIFVTTF